MLVSEGRSSGGKTHVGGKGRPASSSSLARGGGGEKRKREGGGGSGDEAAASRKRSAKVGLWVAVVPKLTCSHTEVVAKILWSFVEDSFV